MNEWGFAGEIKSWWDGLIQSDPSLQLGRVRIEESPEDETSRADITLYDAQDNHLLVLELRLPDHPDADPLAMPNVINAMTKASQMGARWSATSDALNFRLLDNHRHVPLRERAVPVAPLTYAATRSNLDVAASRDKVRAAWEGLLRRLAPVLTDLQQAPRVAADEFFIESLRASLARPFAAIRDGMNARRESDSSFRDELIRWMVREQGWTHDAEDFDSEVERVARVVAYVFATRLLFYGALRRARSGEEDLPPIELPSGGDPVTAQAVLRALFEHARDVTGDYATVFVTDSVTTWALLTKPASLAWVRVLSVLDHFELESLSFDVLGQLFERLIDPEERYEWGQHYTSPDIVDLMLSAALPDGTGPVMDPASGGGTFLVRAYARKQALNPGQSHNERLSEIIGLDISAFAASVSTINLASQDLSSDANYPHVAASSFFKIDPQSPFVSLPDSDGNKEPQYVPTLSAVVCNPPYIGFSSIGDRKDEAQRKFERAEPHRKLRGRFNYHLYFWFHAAQFLAEDARIAFITSGEWYDSDYGVPLQSWLLDNFHIELVIESMAEQWFSEARVGTVVLVARKRKSNTDETGLKSRFVTLRRPLADLYAVNTDDDAERLRAVDDLRDRLLALDGNGESEDFDFAVTDQSELRALGTDSTGAYVGGAWRSVYLRSPAQARVFAEREDFVDLGELASAQLGLKTGKDDFFFVEAIEGAKAPRQLVRGIGGWEGEIDRSNLRLSLQNPRDLDRDGSRRFVVPRRGLLKRYFSPRPGTRDKGVRDYVAQGEDRLVHKATLVRGNAGETWYRQVRGISTAPWVLPYNSAYDYFAADNSVGAVLNGRFVGVTPKPGIDSDLLGAALNSTFALMSRLLVGVATGNEGAYDVGPPAVRRIRIPDPRKFTDNGAQNVAAVLRLIREKDELLPAPTGSGQVVALRRKLDLALLEALGDDPGDAAAELDRIYASFGRWRSSVEAVEAIVRINRRAVGARGGNRGGDPAQRLARSILDEIGDETAVSFSSLHLEGQEVTVVDALRPEEDDHALIPQTMVKVRTGEAVELGSSDRLALIRELRDLGWAGPMPIPLSGSVCSNLARALRDAADRTAVTARDRASTHIEAEQLEKVVSIVSSRWAAQQLAKLRKLLPEGPATEPNLLQPHGLVPDVPENLELFEAEGT